MKGASDQIYARATLQASRVAAANLVELNLCARPEGHPEAFGSQARSMYDQLLAGLRSSGATPRDVVVEKVFLSSLASQVAAARALRSDFYAQVAGGAPPVTFVQQPPAAPGQLCEVQALVLLPAGNARFHSRRIEGLPAEASGRIVEAGGARQLFVAGICGGLEGDGLGFPAQARSMFERGETCLQGEGLSFRDVVRTWIYVANIDRDYAAMNVARRELYTSWGVSPPPASTGIRGGPYPPDRGCGLDLRAVTGARSVRPLHAPTMNEAPSYGCDFSRGTRVDFEDRAHLYVSGTASIDGAGLVVHPGDITGQANRMLVNVEELLASQGATFQDVVSAITYLKQPDSLDAFLTVATRRGFPEEVPNTICVADICRPDWLCEIEVTAILT